MTKTSNVRFWAILLALASLILPSALADHTVEVLKTKTETYTNVTMVSHTQTHAFIQHSRGVANVKLLELDNDGLIALGLPPRETEEQKAAHTTRGQISQSINSFAANAKHELAGAGQKYVGLPANLTLPQPDRNTLLIALGVVAVCYLFFCYCASLICCKAGAPPGILIWVPVFQILPMIRAAGMSGWWFLAWLIPGVNLVAQVVWCFKISAARGKGIVTAILLILPVTGLFAFLYLAFSGGSGRVEDGPKPIELEPLPI